MIDHAGEAIRKIDEALAWLPGEVEPFDHSCWHCMCKRELTGCGLCVPCRDWVRGDSELDPKHDTIPAPTLPDVAAQAMADYYDTLMDDPGGIWSAGFFFHG